VSASAADGLVLAHGVGTRADLPVPLWLAVVGSAAAVLLSFAALGLLWTRPRLRGDAAGVPLPQAVQVVVDSRALTVVLRAGVLLLTLLVVAVALAGPPQTTSNLAPYAFYITFWVGLVPASLLLGPVWQRVNPLRTLHALLRPLTGPAPSAAALDRLGYWPAAAALLVFGWLELAYPDRARPSVVGTFLVVYGIAQLVASLWLGERWFARGDAFEVTSTLFARLSPFGRREDGRIVLRSPLDGADGLRVERGLAAVVATLLGITAFDGITRTQWWQNGPGIRGDAATLPSTTGLLLTVLGVAALYAGATALAGRLGGGTDDGPNVYAHSVIPIAVGYAVAHYFSLLLLDGQLTWILLSDPFQTGRDLLGTAGGSVDLTAVSPDTISYVQIGAVVLGHVLGVVLAHDRAVRLAGVEPARMPGGAASGWAAAGTATAAAVTLAASTSRARTSQYPLLAVMVAFTVGGIALLLGS
jgi:hypothetical protein